METLNQILLYQMVLNLNQRISKIQEDFQRVTNLRFYHLERYLPMTQQYSWRDTLEISAFPMHINDEKQLEEEVVEIFRGKSND